MLCCFHSVFNSGRNYTIACIKQIIKDGKSSVLITTHIGNKSSLTFLLCLLKANSVISPVISMSATRSSYRMKVIIKLC